MRYIEPRVPRDAAVEFIQRRRFANLYGLLKRRCCVPPMPSGAPKGLPWLERVWLPYFLIDIRVSSDRGEPGVVTVSVEGCSGAFALFQMHENLVEGEIEDECFAPTWSDDRAAAEGRKQLLLTVMRRRGQQIKPYIEETLSIGLMYYPYWVYYYERRRGIVDIEIQDALTGERGGNRTRAGLLAAFVGQDPEARGALAQIQGGAEPGGKS